MGLFPSPVKTSKTMGIAEPFDFSRCLICQDPTGKVTRMNIQSFKRAVSKRKDELSESVMKVIDSASDELYPKWHDSCRKKFTSTNHIECDKRDSCLASVAPSTEAARSTTRGSTGENFDYSLCLICS